MLGCGISGAEDLAADCAGLVASTAAGTTGLAGVVAGTWTGFGAGVGAEIAADAGTELALARAETGVVKLGLVPARCSMPLKICWQTPQRTKPACNLSWSLATRKVVLQ